MKYTKSKYLIAAGFAGLIAFGSLSITNAQDIPAPKDVAAAPADALKSKSGLASKILKKGTGTEHPTAADTVKVHYTGWDKTGKMFDSSVTRGEPIEFGLSQVIKGWTEGVQLMVVGEKRRLWIPAAMAYGEVPSRPGAPAGDLCFDVELIDIKKAPKMPEVPKDLAAAPADAEVTPSGLKSKVLKKGTGTVKPAAADTVEVHYSGWDKTGKMFDSSVMRGETTSFPLNQVIKGWTEGLQLMVAGEKRRFWIPAELAYGKTPARPGAPAGDLVFDVELFNVIALPKAPADLANPPADAVVSGDIKSKIIKPGTGKKPTDTDIVFVNYSGWDIKGNVIDSSIPTGDTVPLPLDKIPPALKSALLLMQVGETRRVWIPTEHIVKEPQPGAPEGPFCYEFELVKILEPKVAPGTATPATPEAEAQPETKPKK